jgi:SH2 domain
MKKANVLSRAAKNILRLTNHKADKLNGGNQAAGQLPHVLKEMQQLELQEELIEQQLFLLKQAEKQFKDQELLLKTLERMQRKKQRTCFSPLDYLSAELKYRLAEQIRRSTPNYELWLHEWFFGRSSQAAVERLLLGNARNRPGAFCLTEGRGSRQREFVLSVLIAKPSAGDGCPSAPSGGMVKHYRVRAYYGYSLSNLRSFACLQDLIDYYSSGRSTIKLGRPCAMPLTHDYAKWGRGLLKHRR